MILRRLASLLAPSRRELPPHLRRAHRNVPLPAISTVHAVLDRHGLVTRGRKARYRASGTPLSRPSAPNDLWCADYKGEFMLADKRYCYPLTISDFASRYLIGCEALANTRKSWAFRVTRMKSSSMTYAISSQSLRPRRPRSRTQVDSTCPAAIAS